MDEFLMINWLLKVTKSPVKYSDFLTSKEGRFQRKDTNEKFLFALVNHLQNQHNLTQKEAWFRLLKMIVVNNRKDIFHWILRCTNVKLVYIDWSAAMLLALYIDHGAIAKRIGRGPLRGYSELKCPDSDNCNTLLTWAKIVFKEDVENAIREGAAVKIQKWWRSYR
jgi:hypothetical protein